MKTLLLLLLLPFSLQAATVCVGPSNTGTGSGADWNNQLSWSSWTPTRGDSAYLIAGTYGGKTLSTAASGTTLIVVRKATPGDHGGISTGWSDSLATGQCSFSGLITIQTSYWYIDGATHGALWSQTRSDYGFAGIGLQQWFNVYSTSARIFGVTISNVVGVALGGSTADQYMMQSGAGGSSTSAGLTDFTLTHFLSDSWQNTVKFDAQNTVNKHTNCIVEYGVMINGRGPGGNHGEYVNNGFSDCVGMIVRYCYFGPATTYTACIPANNGPLDSPQIYANVFDQYDSGNGCISSTSQGAINNAVVYNNTFNNCMRTGQTSWLGNTAASGCIAQNNLIYNMSGNTLNTPVGWSHDYTAYFSTTGQPTETHGQVATGNPFVNSASANFNLTLNTTAGNTLATQFNTDPNGNTRTTWSRGAFEFNGSPPPPDTNAPFLSITNPPVSLYSTNMPIIPIQGLATDNVSVATVVWTNQTTSKFGVAALVQLKWSFTESNAVGTNVLNIFAYDGSGNSTNLMQTNVFNDTILPSITVTNGTNYSTFTTNYFVQGFTYSPYGAVTLVLSNLTTGARTLFGGATNFNAGFVLQSGVNNFLIVGTDVYGNTTPFTFTLTLIQPTPSTPTLLTMTSPNYMVTNGALGRINGWFQDTNANPTITWSNAANGTVGIAAQPGTNWIASVNFLNYGTNVVTVTLVDAASTTLTTNTTFNFIAPVYLFLKRH